MKTFLPKEPDYASREWVLVDAADKPLGRLAVRIAEVLRGRNKPTFSPQVDTGAFVVVVNAASVKLTGRKETLKIYQSFSGYPGGLKEMTAGEVRKRHPDRLITLAVKGMMPKGALSRNMLKRLKVYPDVNHPHKAQNPRPLVPLGGTK